jgi:hypothetical protein
VDKIFAEPFRQNQQNNNFKKLCLSEGRNAGSQVEYENSLALESFAKLGAPRSAQKMKTRAQTSEKV